MCLQFYFWFQKKLLECEYLHDLGRECKQRLQQMKEKCLKQVDDNNAFLTARHKDELMKLVSEKLESENTWQVEKQQVFDIPNMTNSYLQADM